MLCILAGCSLAILGIGLSLPDQWLRGFKLVNGSLYHFSQSGSMNTGWFVDDGTWYCANGSGAIRTGWFYFDSSWYLLDSTIMAPCSKDFSL